MKEGSWTNTTTHTLLGFIWAWQYLHWYTYIHTYTHTYINTYLHIYLWAHSIYKAISSHFMGNVVIIIATFAYTNKSNENSSFVNAFECRLVWASKLSERIFFAFLFVYFFCWRVYYSHHRGLKVSHAPTTTTTTIITTWFLPMRILYLRNYSALRRVCLYFVVYCQPLAFWFSGIYTPPPFPSFWHCLFLYASHSDVIHLRLCVAAKCAALRVVALLYERCAFEELGHPSVSQLLRTC